MDVLLSEIGWKAPVPISRPIHNNLTAIGKPTCYTVSTRPDGILIRRKNGIDRLIDKCNFHTISVYLGSVTRPNSISIGPRGLPQSWSGLQSSGRPQP